MISAGASDGQTVSDHVPPSRKKILVCVPRYLPGYKSGGPIRAISNMIANLSSQFEFFVITRDRDATDTQPFPGVVPGKWRRIGEAQVLYCDSITSSLLRQAFREVLPDLIQLNSFQEAFTRKMLWLRRAGAFGHVPILLAPRGEFSSGARRIKPMKKFVYRNLAKLLGLYDNLHWQASTATEGRDLLRAVPAHRFSPGRIYIAHEFFDGNISNAHHPVKEPGTVRLLFLARISEMKNLHFLIKLLREVRGNIELNLFGPIADKDKPYWNLCQIALKKLPENIQARYFGSLDHAAVPETLHSHHFFVLPTKGENYCHAAVESILNGTPVILSDKTPWANLTAARAGFDISLASRHKWIETLQQCVDMDQSVYSTYLYGTQKYSERFSLEEARQQHLAMFHSVLASVS